MSDYFSKKIDDYIVNFKNDLVEKGWNDKAKKLESLRLFKANWDIDAPKDEFYNMINESIGKAGPFLFNRGGPKDFILGLAKLEPETLRDMYKNLFDDSQNFEDRVEKFIEASQSEYSKNKDDLIKFNPKLLEADQDEKVVTAYLWLHDPKNYFMYSYHNAKAVLKNLNCKFEIDNFSVHRNGNDEVIKRQLRVNNDMYKYLRDKLNEDLELTQLYDLAIKKYVDTNFAGVAKEDYLDENHVMLAIHVGYNFDRSSKVKSDISEKSKQKAAKRNKKSDMGIDLSPTDNRVSKASDEKNHNLSNAANVSNITYKPVKYNTGYNGGFSFNRIVFGAPGTGKSYYIDKQRRSLLGKDDYGKDNEMDYERVTFYPDYSYANFVGTYKPVPVIDGDGKEKGITYKYVPGPFMRTLCKTLDNSREENNVKPYLLIIEEINRANAAAVFGDVFQLLDRGDDGVSVYPIQTSEDMRLYLAEKLGGTPADYATIKIPNNMFIWATMNSADQGVYPLDTAFKRRWDFEYIGINGKDIDKDSKTRDLLNTTVKLGRDGGQQVRWNDLRMAINKRLTELNINEDKQLGPFFIDSKVLVAVEDEGKSTDFIRVFKDKVLMYLYEDAARQKRSGMFKNGDKGYSKICEDFDDNGYKALNIDEIELKNGGSKDSSDGEGSKSPEQDANEENETDAKEGD